jgi:HD-like signal output (HDOD) protein
MTTPEPAEETRPSREGVWAWVDSITERELPLFAQNLAEISSVATARQSSAADLARAITMDISMSVRLLRIANSPVLNPQDRTIDSVRTAVVLMGFDAVRDLAFSLSLVSELQRGDGNDRVIELLAHAFHAATQAQTLARVEKDRSPEEVFVAGLLLNVGEMAFWSRPRPEGEAIEARIAQGEPREAAERAVLGFPLQDLSRRLAEEWRMSGLLRSVLADPESSNSRCASVRTGDAVARVVEAHGWDSREGKTVLDDAAEQVSMSRAELEPLMRDATREAGKMARRFGVPEIERLLSQGRLGADADEASGAGRPPVENASDAAAAGGREQPGPATADPQIELQAVRDLQAQLQEDKPDIDRLMRLALEGLHGGAGMDRAFFAMLSPDRNLLRARYAAGGDREALLEGCRIPVGNGARNLFGVLLQTGKAVWVDAARRDRLGPLIGADIDRWAAGAPFFAMPIYVRSRPVGLLYADRSDSGRALDDEAFTSFRFFGDQIAAGLARR